jgi:hypothetical protein
VKDAEDSTNFLAESFIEKGVTQVNSLRISADIALSFNTNGEAIVRSAGIPTDELVARVLRRLDERRDDSEEYRFVAAWYDKFSRSRPVRRAAISLPPGRDFYFANRLCRCGGKQILVRSRSKFVSKNCIECRDNDYARLEDLPVVYCPDCRVELTGCKEPGVGYLCRCNRCGKSGPLAELLPPWHELFPYSGLAAHGDGRFA